MKYNQTELFYAINSNNLEQVENVLQRVDIKRNEFYDGTITFVTLAVLNRNQLVLRKLIEHGADINKLSYLDYNWPSQSETFNNLETALVTATRHGFTEICVILLEHNAKLNKIDSFNMSALHWAVSLNLPDIVFSLLKHNANPHLKDANNESPLEMAIKNGQMNIVALFAENCVLDYKYREYLLCAIKTGNDDIFRLLLSQIQEGKVKFDMNSIDESVGSLLHYAVILNSIDTTANEEEKQNEQGVQIVKCIVDLNGVEVNIVNKLGETPLHVCRNINAARLLLNKGAVMNICEITGKMPFFTFILRTNYDICAELLKSGCDLDNIDRLGNSLLDTILNCNTVPIKLILMLLEAGVHFDRRALEARLLQKHPKLAHLFEYRLRNPPSLKELSRKALRSHLNRINQCKSIVNSVNKLEKLLPSSLQDYILLNSNKFERFLVK